MIGRGGFGCVYGLVWDRRIIVAVKTTMIAEHPVKDKEISVLRQVGLCVRRRCAGPMQS